MVRSGWATTYLQSGAEYGRVGKEGFLKAETDAKAARRGMWAKGPSLETPAEYKRRFATAPTPQKTAQTKGLFRKLWRWGS